MHDEGWGGLLVPWITLSIIDNVQDSHTRYYITVLLVGTVWGFCSIDAPNDSRNKTQLWEWMFDSLFDWWIGMVLVFGALLYFGSVEKYA